MKTIESYLKMCIFKAMNAIGHFKTITHHKLTVMKLCFRIKLYKQGLLHDLSKYGPTEFITGAKYYVGTKSPNSVERDTIGYSSAWLHHKGRNKHHWEYWVDFTKDGPVPAPMPTRYVLEMFCDRVAASKIYNKDHYTDAFPLDYYMKRKDHYYLHPDTEELIEFLLVYLKDHGLDETIKYINNTIKR